MRFTLALNQYHNIALFYDTPLGVIPEWASIDLDLGEIHIGGSDVESRTIMLDQIDRRIYERVMKESKVLLVQMGNVDGKTLPLNLLSVPLTLAIKT